MAPGVSTSSMSVRVAKPIKLLGSGEHLIQGTQTITVRQFCCNDSPIKPEELLVFARACPGESPAAAWANESLSHAIDLVEQ